MNNKPVTWPQLIGAALGTIASIGWVVFLAYVIWDMHRMRMAIAH